MVQCAANKIQFDDIILPPQICLPAAQRDAWKM